MYYEPGNTAHGLPHNPFKSCVVPRPIGWISTTSRDGADNLAPFNQFDGDVPAELKAELETAAAGIIDGSITVTP